jgi:chemotaxis protein MotB
MNFNSALEAAGFEYDPATGLNKFRSDILFDLGSDAIRPEATPTIREFANAVNSGSASGMRLLIVGHTDDQNIVRPDTAIKHPTNWHLSTDRADAVILELLKLGVGPERIASMGYSEFQPLESSQTDTARQRNRRVELFVVPNDPGVAKWDPASSVR